MLASFRHTTVSPIVRKGHSTLIYVLLQVINPWHNYCMQKEKSHLTHCHNNNIQDMEEHTARMAIIREKY